MNEEHLKRCSSAEWAEAVRKIIPWVLDGVDLGDDVPEGGRGPGVTRDGRRALVPRLTATEIHPGLASSLAARLAGTQRRGAVRRRGRDIIGHRPVFRGRMPEHVAPRAGAGRQDALLAEVRRILRPGGVLAGEDSLDRPELRALHRDATYVPLAPQP